jgi:hypothetical protein
MIWSSASGHMPRPYSTTARAAWDARHREVRDPLDPELGARSLALRSASDASVWGARVEGFVTASDRTVVDSALPALPALPALDVRALARRAAVPALLAALVVTAILLVGGPGRVCADALGRALGADPAWVVLGAACELDLAGRLYRHAAADRWARGAAGRVARERLARIHESAGQPA